MPEQQAIVTPVTVREIPVEKIVPSPFQCRKDFDEGKLKAFAETLKDHGLLNPVNVRPVGDHFELIAGERRWRAAKLLGWQTICAQVESVADQEAAQRVLVENVQREDLNPMERARGYKRLVDMGFTQDQVAKAVGKDPTVVFRFLELLKLPQAVQDNLSRDKLTETHMRYLGQLKDENQLVNTANKAAQEGWSVKETEKRVNQMLGNKPTKPKKMFDSRPADPAKEESQSDPLAELWKLTSLAGQLPEHWVEYWGNGVWKMTLKLGDVESEEAVKNTPPRDLQKKIIAKLTFLSQILQDAEGDLSEGSPNGESEEEPPAPLKDPLDPRLAAMLERRLAKRRLP